MDTLIDSLRAKTTVTNQAAVAQQLGITQAMLSMVLAGKRGIGRKVLVGVVKAFPELADEAIEYLRASWRPARHQQGCRGGSED